MRVSRLITNRRLFILLTSFIVLLVVAGLTLKGTERSATWPERAIMDVQNTVGSWIYRPVSKLTGFLAGIHSLHEMYAENAQLKSEMQNYSGLKAKLQEALAETDRLNKMLGFKTKAPSFHLVPAHVIGRNPAAWSSELTIDVGRTEGIMVNMAVIAADGSLVGRVAETADNSSKVVLITDTEVGDGVSAKILNGTSSQPFGIVTGASSAPGELEMSFLSPVEQVKVGQTVVTSGMSTIFPPGIVIGTVAKVQAGLQGLTQAAEVKPAADLGYLQDVFIVVKAGKGQ